MLLDIEPYVVLADSVHYKHLPINEVSIILSNENLLELYFSLLLE